MQEIVYHTNYKLEDEYWWFVARNRIVRDVFFKLSGLAENDEVLDVGCGTGAFTKMLDEKFTAVGLDSSPLALDYCRKRGLEKLYNSYLDKFPTADWNIKAISMLDVIEHIEDDAGVVKQAYDILPSGGSLIATVPAYQWLWSRHDEVHMHYRRYKKKKFVSLIRNAGFDVEYSTYFNSFLFMPAVLKRFAEGMMKTRKADKEPVDIVSPFIDKLFRNIFLFENKLLPKISFPFGISILVFARKK